MRALALVAAFVLAGCSPITVLSQATPNRLVGQTRFNVLPVVFVAELRVGVESEKEYLSGKAPGEIASWTEAKNAIGARFVSGLAQQGLQDPKATYAIRPTVSFVYPGYNIGNLGGASAEVNFEVSIIDPSGKELDRIAMRPKADGYTIFDRFALCAQAAASMTAEYVLQRTR
jgi:hypothetical protein